MRTYSKWKNAALVLVVGSALVLMAAFATTSSLLLAQEPIDSPPADVLSAGADAVLGTAFTYQGILTSGGQPANGPFDFTFKLFNAATGGAQVGSTQSANDIQVAAGRFNHLLDFGSVFGNTALWVEIAVRPGASTGAYTNLTPRQRLTPAPQAVYAQRAASASSATNAVNATNAMTATRALTATYAYSAKDLILPLDATTDSPSFAAHLTNNGGPVLQLNGSGAFATLYATNSVDGGAARFDIDTGRSGIGLEIYNNGNGNAALLTTSSSANPNPTLLVQGSGAGVIQAFQFGSSDASALDVRNGSTGGNSRAASFIGNVHIQGNLQVTGSVSKGSGSFRIDHPLDPANKYLSHSFVESPDMMNVYNGNVMLDAKGAAMVQLPDYFEALNVEFRYQLTPIGASMPSLHVAEEIADNEFAIAGGAPRGKVSWQVTGIRHDPWSLAHPIVVEEEKIGAEEGYYLSPEVYGLPASMGIGALGRDEVTPSEDSANIDDD